MDFRPSIRIHDLKVVQSGQTIFSNLNLDIRNGCFAVITGCHSSGWNTLLHLLAGIQPLQGGEIDLWGYPINQISRRDMSANICYFPRRYKPVFDYTVQEYVLRGCEARLKPLHGPEPADQAMADQLMRQLQIERLATRDSEYLNNAEQQKIGLARAFMQQAHLMLLDEPLDSLHDEDQPAVTEMIRDYTRENNHTVLAVMQDPRQGLRMADLLIVFDASGIVAALDRQQPDFADAARKALAQALQNCPANALEKGSHYGSLSDQPAFKPDDDSSGSGPGGNKPSGGFIF